MEFWNEGKVHPCLGQHVPTLPVPIKQDFPSMTQKSLEWQHRNGDRSNGTNTRLLVVLDYSDCANEVHPEDR